MKLEHVALSIADRSEIEDFYQDILGMELLRSFTLSKALAKDIFGMEVDTEVFLVQNDSLQLELFLSQEKSAPGFEHLCISVAEREEMLEKAMPHSYKVFRLKREYSDLVFLSDHSGNVFEVKEANQV